MGILDTVNARYAVKKKHQDLASLSPLELISKAIAQDAAISNAVLVEKAGCNTCKGSGKIKAGHVDCPDCGGKKEVEKSAHPGFASVANSIADKEGLSKDSANAILASSTRNASATARKKNPNLGNVKKSYIG